MKNTAQKTLMPYNLKESVKVSPIFHNTLQNSARVVVCKEQLMGIEWLGKILKYVKGLPCGSPKEDHVEPHGALRITEVVVLTTVLCYKNSICCGEEMLFLGVWHRTVNYSCGKCEWSWHFHVRSIAVHKVSSWSKICCMRNMISLFLYRGAHISHLGWSFPLSSHWDKLTD